MAFAAKRFARWRLGGKRVRLSYEEPLEDKYGRLLAYVTPADGPLFNEEAVREGYAEVLRTFPHDPDMMRLFEIAEAQAKDGKRGLWSPTGPPEATPAQVPERIGRMVRVTMTVARIEERRGFLFILPAGGDFDFLIPVRRLDAFGGVAGLSGRTVTVSGFVETYRGRVQIMGDSALQLKRSRDPSVR
jgi:hypothetical protein